MLFPVTPSQSNGIEDARFVRFRDDDGSIVYYATYTAYDGRLILPQFIETPDFLHFRFSTLNGPAVQNKGMALFPRKINGQYAMLGRQDYENIYVMFSDHPHFWQTAQLAVKPTFPWEFIQMGNCGSPIETDAGWLVFSHGVGAMRKYCIGAFLLDRDDPTQVLGRTREPISSQTKTSAKATCPTWFIPAAACCMTGGSSCPTPCRTMPPPLPPCHSTKSWRRWNSLNPERAGPNHTQVPMPHRVPVIPRPVNGGRENVN